MRKQSIILLHGLFGGLSNWEGVIEHFGPTHDVHVPLLPIMDEHKENELEYFVNWLQKYIDDAGLKDVILVGNSLGGHVAILYAHRYQYNVRAIVLTGSSGLYEKTSLGSFPRRHSYSFIRKHVANTFYDPATATDELVDEVFKIVGDNRKCLRIIKTSKRTQNTYVTDMLPEIKLPVLLIWGREDNVTPPHVAGDFLRMLPDAKLVFLEKCGHAPMMERPKEFNEIFGDFLNEICCPEEGHITEKANKVS
jgi:pimeloyl-ACP methyl ester carboxylesterase